MVEPIVSAIYYEACISILGFFFVFAVIRKYLQKKNQITLYLLLIFFFLNMGIVVSLVGKILWHFVYYDVGNIPVGVEAWITLRVMGFRVSFFFVCIAMYVSFLLKTALFEKEMNPKKHAGYFVIGLGCALFALMVYELNNWFLDVFAFLAVFLYMFMVYLPFLVSFVKLYRKVEDLKYKRALLSIALMAVFFILIFLCFLLDRIILMLTGEGYTVFYYLAWAFSIFGFISAYFGYLAPKAD